MGEAWSEAEAFGSLRSLLNEPPSGRAFGRLVALVSAAESVAPGLYRARWEGYVQASLRDWPPGACATTAWGREAAIEAASTPWASLLKGLTLKGFDLGRREDAEWIASELRSRFVGLEHLGFEGMSVLKAQVERACEVGTFDGVRSLSFQDCAFRPSTFDVLLGHLEVRADVERLAFRQCGLGVAQVERLCASPLLGSLVSLDLSWNHGFKTAGCEALAAHVGEFVGMRELSLGGTDMSVKGATALARAAWAPAMGMLELRGAAMSSRGLEAFIEAERLELLMRRGASTRLDLWGFSLRERALRALSRCEALEQVDDLWLHGNMFDGVDALVGSPYLTSLRSLDVSGNPMSEDAAEGLLGLIRQTSPRALSVDGLRLGDAFVEGLCAPGASDHLEALAVTHHECYGERALSALLDWAPLGRLRALHASCLVERESPLVERASATGLFEASDAGDGDRVVLRASKGGVFHG